MNASIAYLFDPGTGIYAGAQFCQTCIVTGNLLRPENSLLEPPPSAATCAVVRAVNGRWVVDLDASKAKAAATVDSQHAEALRGLTGNATTEERDTWPNKAAAARAYLDGAGTASQRAMIEMEAAAKGVPAADMAAKVAGNADQFELMVGKAAAFRQKAKMAIKQTTSVQELEIVLAALRHEMKVAMAAIVG
jgi:hypothetical protein